MFERERTVYAFLLGYCRKLVADIDEARFADQPSPGVNHPAWLLGHLAISTDYALMMLGQPLHATKRWFVTFGPGSAPKPDRSLYPPKSDLLSALGAGHERVALASAEADAGRMSEPHGLDLADFRVTLPTRGDLLAHLMTSHEASHLGHLSNWRRQMGMPYLF